MPYCTACMCECEVIKLDTSFDAWGPDGRSRTYYGPGHGELVSDCCEEPTTNLEDEDE